MEPGDDSIPPMPPQEERTVFPRAPRPRSPEHELRDRAKAAKLRHKAAKARVKARRLEDHARVLQSKAVEWDRRADELDGVVQPQFQAPANE